MTAPDWYSLDHLPPWRMTRVVVIWDHREMTVWATRTAKGERGWWRDGERGDPERMPPAIRRGAPWPAEPACWRPDGWTWPAGHAVPPRLPTHAVPRMTTTRQAFGAVEEAEAADLAREMEADRAAARAGADADSREGSGRGCVGLKARLRHDVGNRSAQQESRGQGRHLWWLDSSGLRYDAPGEISRSHAEARLMRAIAADGFLRAAAGEGLGTHGTRVWDRLSQDEAHRLAEAEMRNPPPLIPRLSITPADRDDQLVAGRWFLALGHDVEALDALRRSGRWAAWGAPLTKAQRLCALAAHPSGLSFGEIGWVLGVSRQAAQQGYGRAINTVHRVANGGKTRALISRERALERVRDGNRAARIERAGL